MLIAVSSRAEEQIRAKSASQAVILSGRRRILCDAGLRDDMTEGYNPLAVLGVTKAEARDHTTLKRAYHTALLAAHPDKMRLFDGKYTVDQVREAYLTLISPSQSDRADGSRLGYAIIDLDDFDCHEQANDVLVYSHPCRCGHGFSITENDLEHGRDVVGCEGCSLLVRVTYQLDQGDCQDSKS